jgi:Flp pilus assembly protein TadD/intracellular septation protein A
MNQKRWICLALVLLTLICFGHVCFSEFINFDDPVFITGNPQVLGGLTRDNVVWAFTDSCYRAGYWVPLTWLSLQADATLFGPQSAWGFHLTSLVLHVANVVVFFLVLQRMTGDVWRSAMAAALFGIHPLRVESVAWVTERKDMVSTLLLLVTVGAYARYADRPTWRRYGLTLVCFLLGLMAKPTLVTLPFALLLLDYWPLYRLRLGQTLPADRARLPGVSWQRLLLEKAPFFALSAVISPVTMHFAQYVGAVHTQIPLGVRLSVCLSGYLGYLEKTFWPTNLAVLYPFDVPSDPRVVLAAGVLAAITAAALYWARQRPPLVVGWLWFLGTLFPVSGIVQVGHQAMADRYTYVPHLGFAVMIVWGLGDLAPWRRLSPLARSSLAGLVLAALGALTWIQVWYWQNSETLYTHSLSVTEKNYTLHHNLSGWWFEHGNTELAEYHVARAVEIAPENFRARFYYGNLLNGQKRNEEAVPQLEAALRVEPDNPDAHLLLGKILRQLGRWEEARRHLERSVQIWASNPRVTPDLGDMPTRRAMPQVLLADILLRAGNPDEALHDLAAALKTKADVAGAHHLMGIAYGRLGRWADAEDALQRAVDLQPANASIRAYLAFAQARQGKNTLAARGYAEILANAPDWPQRTSDLALTLATEARFLDATMAQELAAQICEATDFKDPRWLNTLAAAQAANGAFARARATAQQALDLKPEPALANEIRDRLRLYKKNQALPVTKDEK